MIHALGRKDSDNMPIDSHIKESILLSVRNRLEIVDDDDYDQELVMDINTALSQLNEIGIGVQDFVVEDDQQTWSDFLGSSKKYEQAKTFVFLKVKKLFDPPTSSVLSDSIDKQIAEIFWRLRVKKDNEKGGNT